MSHLPLQTLQIALLYENHDQLVTGLSDWPALIGRLNGSLPGGTAPFELRAGATNDTHLMVSNETFHITVARVDRPLDLQGFAGPLAAPFYVRMRPDLVEGVQAHSCAALVNVGLGDVPVPLDDPGIAAMLQSVGVSPTQTQELFEERLAVTQAMGRAICALAMPSVVHWGQSDQLLDGTAFARLAAQPFSPILYVHPGFSGSGAKVGDSYCMGVDAYGTHHLIGRHVQFAEHPQDMARSYQEVLAFVLYCRSLGRVLGPGETFGTDDGEMIEVHDLGPTERHPHGVIELRKRAPDDKGAAIKVSLRADEADMQAAIEGKRNALSGRDKPGWRGRLSGLLAAGLRPERQDTADTPAPDQPAPVAAGQSLQQQVLEIVKTRAIPMAAMGLLVYGLSTVGIGLLSSGEKSVQDFTSPASLSTGMVRMPGDS
jgi:hypothetical protein